MNRTTHSLAIATGDDSQTGSARRRAASLASALDFSDLRCGQLSIVVTEMTRNLALHGGGGELLLTPWTQGDTAGMDLLGLDSGRGIPDIGAAMEDGYSTGGTAGTGLGAIERLAETFQIHSRPGKGTALFARLLRSEADPGMSAEIREGSVSLPVAGESVCGDAWASYQERDRHLYIMADGLGHGPMAFEAAAAAVHAFSKATMHGPKEIVEAVHLALQKTRGAAVAVAEVRADRKLLTYAGCGNIASVMLSTGKARSLVSANGTAGHNIGNVQQFSYPWEKGALLVMHSDGLAARWNVDDYPGLAVRHPALIAGVLYRDFSRKRDDATVLVTELGTKGPLT